MKKYIISRTIMIIETIIVFSIIFLINKETLEYPVEIITMNNDNNKAVSQEIIQESQKELYNDNLNKSLEESGKYDAVYTFMGELTGYSGDCPLCSGYLACPPRTNVLKNGIYYDDKTYGKIRIVASSKNYSCGTILKFKVSKLSEEPIIAIVLDRGVSGNVIDLLTDSAQTAVNKIGRVRNLEFEVLREGWK